MSISIRIFCGLILFVVSTIPAFGQSPGNPANNLPVSNPASPDSPKTSLLQSELSSAPLAPCVAIPTIGNFSPNRVIQGTVDISLWATITFPTSMSSGTCVPTTCTWTISSVPPGPLAMYLVDQALPYPAGLSSPVFIDSTTGVITNQGRNSDWFPPDTNKYESFLLYAQGDWVQSSDPASHNEPYPTLQWGPFNVTLVYQ